MPENSHLEQINLTNAQEEALNSLKDYPCVTQQEATDPTDTPNPTVSISIETQEGDEVDDILGINPNSVFSYGIKDVQALLLYTAPNNNGFDLLSWMQQFRPGLNVSVNIKNLIIFGGRDTSYYRPDSDHRYREEIYISMDEREIQRKPIEFLAYLLHEFGHALQDRLEIDKPLGDQLTEDERRLVMESEENATAFAIRAAQKIGRLLELGEDNQLLKEIELILNAKLDNYRRGLNLSDTD